MVRKFFYRLSHKYYFVKLLKKEIYKRDDIIGKLRKESKRLSKVIDILDKNNRELRYSVRDYKREKNDKEVLLNEYKDA